MTFSTAIGMLSVIGFSLVDTLFIAQLGVTELAAISFTPTIILSLSSLTIGLGIGLSVLISKVVTDEKKRERQQICSYSILLSLLLAIVFATFGAISIDPVFSLLGASDQVLIHINNYMFIWYVSMPLLVLPIVGNSAIRGMGDAKFPAKLMLFSSGLNLLFDPILIFGIAGFEGFGIAGAAWASMLARLITTIVALYYLSQKFDLLTFVIRDLHIVTKVWRDLLKIALPAGATRVLTPLSMGVVVIVLAQHGEDTVAAFGVGSKIEAVSMIIITGLSTIIGPFIGQNLSSNLITRAKTAIKYGINFSVIWGIGNSLLLLALARPLGDLFSDNSNVINHIVFYLSVIPISLTGLACQIIISSCCNPLGEPYIALKLSIVRMWFFCIPAIIIGNQLAGYHGVIWGIFIANSATGLIALLMLEKVKQRNNF